MQERVPGTVFAGFAAQLHHTAVRKHHRHGTDIFASTTVFHSPHPTGIGGHVTANRSVSLTGIGRIHHAALCAGGGQVGQQDAGFNMNQAIVQIPAQNMVHLGRINDHAAMDGRTAAAEPGSGSARNDGDIVRVQDFAGF